MAFPMVSEASPHLLILGLGYAGQAIARAALYDPRWPWHAAVALGATLPIASQYLRSEPREARGVFKPR